MENMSDLIINPNLQIEVFVDGSLVLNIKTRELFEISADESWLLMQIKSSKSEKDIKTSLIDRMHVSQSRVDKHINRMYNDLLKKKLIFDRGEFMKGKYIQNPAVNLREEDEDGALLFNPDSNRIQLLNNTGFFIWQLCSEGKTSLEISEAVKREFSDVPEEQVNEDIKQFLDEMTEIGFIEIIRTKKSKGV
ncbi:MAG: PqqD family protein [Acidobacteria bacterium]|nr:PqqD family protein [Acidobacteriota bacterium]